MMSTYACALLSKTVPKTIRWGCQKLSTKFGEAQWSEDVGSAEKKVVVSVDLDGMRWSSTRVLLVEPKSNLAPDL